VLQCLHMHRICACYTYIIVRIESIDKQIDPTDQ